MVGPVYGLSRAETERRGEQLLNYLDLWTERNTYVDQASIRHAKEMLTGDGPDSQSSGAVSGRAF